MVHDSAQGVLPIPIALMQMPTLSELRDATGALSTQENVNIATLVTGDTDIDTEIMNEFDESNFTLNLTENINDNDERSYSDINGAPNTAHLLYRLPAVNRNQSKNSVTDSQINSNRTNNTNNIQNIININHTVNNSDFLVLSLHQLQSQITKNNGN